MAALHERRQGLAQRGTRNVQPVGEVALGRQAAARLQQAEPDCRAQPFDGLLERGRRLHRLEDGLQRRCALRSGHQFHASNGTPAAPLP
jgi:hypothetical protein